MTAGWRVTGLVTQVPSRTLEVLGAVAVSVTHGSRNSAGESQMPMRS